MIAFRVSVRDSHRQEAGVDTGGAEPAITDPQTPSTVIEAAQVSSSMAINGYRYI